MPIEYLSVLAVIGYHYFRDVLDGYVQKYRIAPDRAYLLGFLYPVSLMVPALLATFIYRELNGIQYGQEYLAPVIATAAIGLGFIRGRGTKQIAITSSCNAIGGRRSGLPVIGPPATLRPLPRSSVKRPTESVRRG